MRKEKYYAGIGSRKTPLTLYDQIKSISKYLENKGYILRSGGAGGADKFFEESVNEKEIYLPWKGFNSNSSRLYAITEEALKMAKKYHPNWSSLSDAGKKLMARNCYQVLGIDLKTPVEFIVCYTPDGKASGGTGQALRISKDLNIPVFNLFDPESEKKLRVFLNDPIDKLF